jgi:hypothetical protein
LEFYIAFHCPGYELFYFREDGNYWILVGSFNFPTTAGDKKKIFITERGDGHCAALIRLNGKPEVSM